MDHLRYTCRGTIDKNLLLSRQLNFSIECFLCLFSQQVLITKRMTNKMYMTIRLLPTSFNSICIIDIAIQMWLIISLKTFFSLNLGSENEVKHDYPVLSEMNHNRLRNSRERGRFLKISNKKITMASSLVKIFGL